MPLRKMYSVILYLSGNINSYVADVRRVSLIFAQTNNQNILDRKKCNKRF